MKIFAARAQLGAWRLVSVAQLVFQELAEEPACSNLIKGCGVPS